MPWNLSKVIPGVLAARDTICMNILVQNKRLEKVRPKDITIKVMLEIVRLTSSQPFYWRFIENRKKEKEIALTHNSLINHTSTIIEQIKDTIYSYNLVDNKYVNLLEQELSNRYGRPVVAVSNGTMGLVTTFQTILKVRKKVIVPEIGGQGYV